MHVSDHGPSVCTHPMADPATRGPPVDVVRIATFGLPDEPLMQPTTRRVRRASARRNQSLLLPQDRITAANVQAANPFTWTRCLVSLFSYALLLSDVVRSGFGIKSATLKTFPQPYPDSILHFGPYAYRILHLSTANASAPDAAAISDWPYKFDTTSVSTRSVVHQLNVPNWPPCLLYHGRCGSKNTVSARTVFAMIDSLVGAVSVHTSRPHTQGHITVRAEYDWVDRLHHFALPWFFQRTVKRTTQAIHYRINSTTAPLSLCGRSSSVRPYACNDAWIKYDRFCNPATNSYCADVKQTIWSHIESRMARLLASFPNHTVEFALIEGADDHTRPGLTFQGRKLFDVVTMTRVLDCRASWDSCHSVAVEDYRYEGAKMTINAADWFMDIAFIRGVGQCYAWLRLAALCVGAYYALGASDWDGKSSRLERAMDTLRTVFIIPSQVVIYGSIFPILCYVAAHLIDSCAVYELVALHFNSTFGYFHFDLETFVTLSAVSMRSLWPLALTCHLIVAAYSRRSWSPTHGALGIPEFSISFVASLTIFAQVRSTAWRSTRIRQVFEVVRSTRRHRWQTISYATPRGALNRLLFGSTIDLQCLLTSFLLFLALLTLSWLASVLLPRLVRYRMTLFSRTLVPYSAGLLWMTNGLVVCWNGAFVVRIPSSSTTKAHSRVASLVRAMPFRRLSRVHQFPWRTTSASAVELVIADTRRSEQLQRDMHSVAHRSREVAAMVFLVNLAVMTDPVAFCRLRALRGRLVALYESQLPVRRVLLPRAAGLCDADVPLDWGELELVAVRDSKQLLWCELLLCG